MTADEFPSDDDMAKIEGDHSFTPIDLKPHRSVSQLTTWLSCGEAYRLARVAKAPRKPAAWLLQGIAFHGAIEFWERNERRPSEGDTLEEFDTVWTLEAEGLPDVPLDEWLTGGRTKGSVDYMRRVDKGRQQVRDYIAWANATVNDWRIHRDSQYPDGIGVEVPLDIDLFNPDPILTTPMDERSSVKLIGYIDQIVETRDGTVMPRDLKTGTKLPDSPIQLGVYAMALREQYALDDVWWGDFYMAKNSAPTQPYALNVYTRDYVAEKITLLNRAIESDIFIANPGNMCNVCDVWQWCREVGPNRGAY